MSAPVTLIQITRPAGRPKAMVSLTIDGHGVSVPEGTSILTAAAGSYALDHHLDRLAEAPPGLGRHDPTHAVVAPGRVTDADHHNGAGHVRSTVSSRKCVAHEMHGS